MPVSPASRAVVLVAKALNIKLVLREIDISRGEHMTPEFLKVRNHKMQLYNQIKSYCNCKSPLFLIR